MKKITIISIITNVLLIILLVSMFNTKISWEHNGKIWSYKLGDFYLDRFRGEWIKWKKKY